MTKRWGIPLVLAAVLAASGCGKHGDATQVRRPTQSASPSPVFDTKLPPAQAVLRLVPSAATTLTVTDFDQVRAQYGASPGDKGFWKQATKHSPLLSTGMLRPYAGQLKGFNPDDVTWEAHYSGGGTDGWVLAFSPVTDMSAVQQAVTAGVGPLKGATVDTAAHLAESSPPTASSSRWTELADLVGPVAESTYVERGCLPGDTQGQRVQPLTAYAVSFGQSIATAYLGLGRDDLFTRMRLGSTVPTFAADYTNGAADPSTGRIGFTMTDPVDAAQQALRRKLPFAVCAG